MRLVMKALVCVPASVLTLTFCASTALAIGEGDHHKHPPADGPTGDASGNTLTAAAGASSIKVSQVSGGFGGNRPKALTPVDPNWKPPACWYEPVATPEQLKSAVDRLKKGGDLVHVTPTLSWGEDLMVSSYEKDKSAGAGLPSYKNYNLGKSGMFWRGVMNKDLKDDPESWSCERNLFWQEANTVPDDKHAPTPDVLAAYAYDRINVPDTKFELKPATKSTVNLPTWVWSDKGRFQDVKVRAELPHTNLWAETTAKPVSLHLEAGTPDAETYPASGECAINDDGTIGAPYSKGDAEKTPPCGITYLRATDGKPYQLKASVTWQISWTGSGGANGDLPDGTFESTQDMNVQEIQSVNR
ncbi:hypothetical protein [Streptomyces sp. NBC_01306]|uniref:hypothetical protein n=1 Tax=Streptomyces sp. NBC_01306 TaxID=2903819 RepID=UPI002258FB95|nr:hypothetical protein [Streptomyces sp. NBC_01306]MCX4726256.1 hypothetical protein [Streptomyces sp. NBC_01306]